MKDIDFAIERGFRLFENELRYFHFFMIQVKLPMNALPDGNYIFVLNNHEKKLIYQRKIIIDSVNQRIITVNSHEDPLVQADSSYMICFQLWDDTFNHFPAEPLFMSLLNADNEYAVLSDINVGNLKEIFANVPAKMSILKEYCIYSLKECVFRLHMGSENGEYSEKEYCLKAGELFDFKPYLNYSYLGLQCSYESEVPEIEEKHIVLGQKGMTLSCEYRHDNISYHALLPFSKIYQTLYLSSQEKKKLVPETLNQLQKEYAFVKEDNWEYLTNIEDLLNYYKRHTIHFFESSPEFLVSQYRHFPTYGLQKVVSPILKGHKHIDLEVCQDCSHASKCMQIVPSGLSPLVFRKNIALENSSECAIFQLIEDKVS